MSIVEAGGIQPLLTLMQNSSKDKENGSSLSPLIALLGSGSAKAERNAAGALGALSRENVENEEEIARMLVELLGGSGAPEKAARAISRLASQSVDSQNAIAAAGGIAPLVALVTSGTDGQKENAGGALGILAFDADLKRQIERAGYPLV